MTELFAVLSAGGAVGMVAFVVLWAIEFRRAGRLDLELERARDKLEASEEQRKRLVLQLAAQKREIRELEESLPSDPASVRNRIRRLLQT